MDHIERSRSEDQALFRRHHDSGVSVASSYTTTIGTTNAIPNDPYVERSRSTAITVLGSIANLCSATLGAGILALPFAFYEAGIICGTILLLGSAWATVTSIGLIVESCDRYNLATYEKIVETCLGKTFRTVVEISILIFCCGTAVGYVIAVGDIIERVNPFMTLEEKRIAMLLVWFIAMLPLSCLRRMKSLEFASSVGIIGIMILLVAATVHLIHHMHANFKFDDFEYHDTNHYFPANGSWVSVLRACPIFFYAFSSQVNVAQIFEELPTAPGDDEEGKVKKMKWVTVGAILVCGLLYASISFVTLLDFGDGVKSNILSCYDLNDETEPLLHVAFFAMALAVVIAFPLNIFPARLSGILMWEKISNKNFKNDYQRQQIVCLEVCDEMKVHGKQPLLSSASDNNNDYNSSDGGEEDPLQSPFVNTQQQNVECDESHESVLRDDDYYDEIDGQEEEAEEFHFLQHATVTTILAGSVLGLALVVPNISIVFGLLGGTTSSLLGFIVPGLLGLQLDRKRISAWFLVTFGSLIAVLTTSTTIYSMIIDH